MFYQLTAEFMTMEPSCSSDFVLVGSRCFTLFHIQLIVSCRYVSFSGLITSVREETAIFLPSITRYYVVAFLFAGVSTGQAASFYCSTTCAFHIVIM